MAWRFLQGAGSAGLINLVVVLIGDSWDGPRRAAMIGRNSAVLTACIALLPLLGGALTELVGWRGPFLVYPLGLLTAGAVARGLPRSSPRTIDMGQQLRDLGPALRQPAVGRALAAGAVTFALIFGLLLTVLPIHLQQAFGATPSVRGLVLGLPALANTAVALSAGWLQRFSKRALLVTATLAFAVSLVAMGVAPTLPLLVAAVVCFGAWKGLMVPNLQDIVASTGDTSRGAVVALFVSASRTGQTVGPIAAGAAYAVAGAPPGGRFPKDAFDIDLDAATVTCPGAHTVVLRRRSDGSGWANFDDRCATCPLQAQCTTSSKGRTVKVGPHERLLQAQRLRQQDPAWAADYKANRPKVERSLAQLVRRLHGGRKARVRGTPRVDQDWNLNATARNIARLATLGVRHTPAGWQAATG